VAQLVGGRHAVDEQDALQVVVLVLDDTAGETFELELELVAVDVLGLDFALVGALDLGVDAREGQASLLVDALVAKAVDDGRVDQRELLGFVVFLACGVDDQDALADADLGGGQADALGLVHPAIHRVDDGGQARIKGLDGHGLLAKDGLGVQGDGVVQLFGH